MIPCVEHLEPPVPVAFSYFAAKQEIDVTVSLTKSGVNAIYINGADTDHDAEVRRVLKLSRFSTACAGRSLNLVYEFVEEGEPAKRESVTHEFLPPNRLRVKMRPLIPSAPLEAPQPSAAARWISTLRDWLYSFRAQ